MRKVASIVSAGVLRSRARRASRLGSVASPQSVLPGALIEPGEAPFITGPSAITDDLLEQLLRKALERGGDFADLFFEYRRHASISMEDGRVRSVGGGVDLGLGVRVVQGAAVGYAYSESLELDEMLAAAQTASRIA